MNLTDHHCCLALSTMFRGKLCQQLSSRRARPVPAGQTIYTSNRHRPAQETIAGLRFVRASSWHSLHVVITPSTDGSRS